MNEIERELMNFIRPMSFKSKPWKAIDLAVRHFNEMGYQAESIRGKYIKINGTEYEVSHNLNTLRWRLRRMDWGQDVGLPAFEIDV